jgi:hypothetical protein
MDKIDLIKMYNNNNNNLHEFIKSYNSIKTKILLYKSNKDFINDIFDDFILLSASINDLDICFQNLLIKINSFSSNNNNKLYYDDDLD